jgi:hypothetical protein
VLIDGATKAGASPTAAASSSLVTHRQLEESARRKASLDLHYNAAAIFDKNRTSG